MGILSEKSNKSYNAAILLLSKAHYCNSIQCSYFSCLQLAKDKILTNSTDPERLERELKASNSSHKDIIQKARDSVKGNPREKGLMTETMLKMKRWRTNAIYDNVQFLEINASDAIDNCNTVNHILNKI